MLKNSRLAALESSSLLTALLLHVADLHTHVHTYWRAALYIRESNSFPLYENEWIRLARSFRELSLEASLKNTTPSIRYESSFFILYKPISASSLSSLFVCVQHVRKAGSL